MYKKIIVPLFYWFDPEKVQITLRSILHGIESQKILLFFSTLFLPRKIDDKRLHVKVAGIVFANPILVAAGFDKYAEVIRMLSAFGFSGVEVGSVVVYPQPGNPKPRLFIHSSGVILNHFGFNSPGMEVVAKNLEKYKHIEVPIGINIGKNKYVPNPSAPELYTIAIRRFYEYASYFVINISSPNTKNLRDLHEKKALEEIIKQVLLVMKQIGGIRPLFIKIAPDISQKFLDEVIRVVIKNKLTGIIASNTTTNMHLKAKYTQDWEERPGGA